MSHALPSKKAVLDALLATHEEYVREALGELAVIRPHLLHDQSIAVAKEVSPGGETWNSPSLILSYAAQRALSSPSNGIKKQHTDIKNELPTVQFTSKVYFCHESDGSVLLPVVRTGDRSGKAEVCYTTKDGGAKSGRNFVANAGTIVFQPGEIMCYIRIEILDDNQWDETRTFMVDLLEDGLLGAVRGKDLWRAVVVEIDHTVFPSNEFSHLIPKDLTSPRRCRLDNHSEASKFRLMWGCAAFAWKDKVLRNRSFKVTLRDQVFNAHLLLTMLLGVYMIDSVVSDKDDSELYLIKSKRGTLIAIAVFTIGAMFPLHFMDFLREKLWKTGGPLRLQLQSQILRRFFHFTAEVRSQVGTGEVIEALTSDIEDLIRDGFNAIMTLPCVVGQLVVVVLFNVSASMIFEKPLPLIPLLSALFVFPFCVFTFLIVFGPRVGKAVKDQQEKLALVHDSIDEAINEYQLFNEFAKRQMYQKRFEGYIAQYNDACVVTSVIMTNNKYFLMWLTCIIKALYVLVGGLAVIDGQQTLGIFIANLTVIDQIGDSWREIATLASQMQSAFPAMNRIVCMMNLPSDFEEAFDLSLDRQKKTARYLESAESLDLIPIVFEGVASRFGLKTNLYYAEMNLSGKMKILQGEIVCLLGHHGSGKAVVLKLLDGAFPSSSAARCAFVPAHVRMLQVLSEPMFYLDTLRANVLLGLERDFELGIVRARAICKRLGLPDRVTELLDSDMVADWRNVLSDSECQLLSIARVLVADVEFIIFHKPLGNLTPENCIKFLQILREFTTQRGVESDPQTVNLRRPRTCLVSSVSDQYLEFYDKVYEIDNTGIHLTRGYAVDDDDYNDFFDFV